MTLQFLEGLARAAQNLLDYMLPTELRFVIVIADGDGQTAWAGRGKCSDWQELLTDAVSKPGLRVVP